MSGLTPRVPPLIYNLSFDSTGLSGGLGSTDQPDMRVSGLEDATTYFFSVTAWDTSGNESTFSNEISRFITVPLVRILKQNV